MNNKSLILEEDNVTTLPSSSSSSSFRRRNNILIIILTTFFISLALTTSAFSFYLVHYGIPESADSISGSTSVRIFYSNAACSNPSCKEAFNSIIVGKSIADPTQILVLSLQAAATHLKEIISFLYTSSAAASVDDGSSTDEKTTIFAFKNCSDSLRNGSGRIHEALEIIRVDPFAEMRSGEERFRLMKKISAAEEDLKHCVGDLGKVVVESTAVSEVILKVHRVMVYVSSSGEFVYNYSSVLSRSWDEYDLVWNMIWNVFGVCVFGLEGWLIFFLFRKIWKSR